MKNSCNSKCKSCSAYVIPGSPCVNCSGTSCESVYYTSCVVYNSDNLECFGIDSGETLTDVILKLLAYAFPECHTTTTTSTSTTTSSTTTTTTLPVTSTTTKFVICKTCH